MIILLPLLRKLAVRTRAILGGVFGLIGLIGLSVGLAAAPGLVVGSSISVATGAVCLASAWSSRR